MQLPHRFPFRLVDRRSVTDGEAVTCMLTVNASWLRGPELANALSIEAMAQACALLDDDPGDRPAPRRWLAGIEDARFGRPLAGGDVAEIHLRLERRLGPVARVHGEIRVGGEAIIEARLLLASAE